MARKPTETEAAETAETAPKKSGVCLKMYLLADGTESRSAHQDAETLEFRFANGETRRVVLGQLPENIEHCLNLFGRSEKFGNFYAGAKGDANEAVDMFDAGYETLAGGEWSERKEGVGAAPSLVFAAVMAVLAARGTEPDDETQKAIRVELSTKEGRKAALDKVSVKAEYEQARLARQQERLTALQAKAAGAEEEELIPGIA